MSIIEATRKHSLSLAICLGVAGGAALIATKSATTRGPVVLLPYAILVVLCAGYLKLADIQTYRRRFFLALTAFMTATAMLYVFVATAVAHGAFDIPLLGHAWRAGVMLAIGMIVSALVAFFGSASRPSLAARN